MAGALVCGPAAALPAHDEPLNYLGRSEQGDYVFVPEARPAFRGTIFDAWLLILWRPSHPSESGSVGVWGRFSVNCAGLGYARGEMWTLGADLGPLNYAPGEPSAALQPIPPGTPLHRYARQICGPPTTPDAQAAARSVRDAIAQIRLGRFGR